MTKEQRGLLGYWAISCGFLLAMGGISFLDAEHEQTAMFGLMGLFGVLSLFQDFSYYRGFGDGSKRIGAFIDKHPALKIWLVVFCAVFLPFLIYRMQTDRQAPGSLYWLSVLLLIGPVAVLSETDRFRSMGRPNA